MDLTQYGLQVSSATNASPIQLGVTAAHSLSTGDRLLVADVGGNTAANGVWASVTVVYSTHVTLDGSTGNASYTSSGFAIKLSHDQFLSDVAVGARVSTSAQLTTPTATFGVLDGDDVRFRASRDPRVRRS